MIEVRVRHKHGDDQSIVGKMSPKQINDFLKLLRDEKTPIADFQDSEYKSGQHRFDPSVFVDAMFMWDDYGDFFLLITVDLK